MARHGLTELGTDCQLRLVASANAAASGDLSKASRELDAAHRQAALASKAPRRPARRSVAAPAGQTLTPGQRAALDALNGAQPPAPAAPDPVAELKRRLGVA